MMLKNTVFPKVALCLVLLSSMLNASAQTWDEVQHSNLYLWGVGIGATLNEADRAALSDLTSRIAVHVESRFDYSMQERQHGGKTEQQQYVNDCVKTYSNATLTGTQRFVIREKPKYEVGRYMLKSEVQQIFARRAVKAADMVAMGLKAEQEGRLDVALRQLYWAHLLTRSLQRPTDATCTDADGRQQSIIVWVPQHLEQIMNNVSVGVLQRDGDDVDLQFTYHERPVASLDFTYFDGRDWSPICSAADGVGTLELAEGNQSTSYRLKLEYEFASEANIDDEVKQVMQLQAGVELRRAEKTVDAAARSVSQPVRTATFTRTDASELKSPTPLADASAYAGAIEAVKKAIAQHSEAGLAPYFTPEGLKMFRQLIFHYGRARIVGTPAISFYQQGQRVTARGLTLSFQFQRGVRRSFVEDLSLTFNSDRRIESVAFGLGKTAEDDILNKGAWDERTRKALTEFLENYKTAFALKRLDFLRTLFAEDAVIIVGNEVKPARQMGVEGQALQFRDKRHIRYNRYTKREYLKNLERCFQSQEFINLRFADNDINKLGKGGEMYGIQISQDYYSTTYGDQGYLFLIVDLNNPAQPIIKVRTWQPEKDPNFGIFSAADFQ